ncbi:MAG: hypothetical protein JWO27_3297 [Frankiales bacterium]|nr:hypothetical protein [Frankiales bacterium]MCW2709746.1 hypothetical protein [Frankiales bacterium]
MHLVSPRRPDPPPLETNDVTIIAAGTAAWFVALVVVLVLKVAGTDIHDWWLWMCAAGTALGLVGVRYCVRRRNALSGR